MGHGVCPPMEGLTHCGSGGLPAHGASPPGHPGRCLRDYGGSRGVESFWLGFTTEARESVRWSVSKRSPDQRQRALSRLRSARVVCQQYCWRVASAFLRELQRTPRETGGLDSSLPNAFVVPLPTRWPSVRSVVKVASGLSGSRRGVLPRRWRGWAWKAQKRNMEGDCVPQSRTVLPRPRSRFTTKAAMDSECAVPTL